MEHMMKITKEHAKMIRQAVSQLEENFHFDLKEFSFVYNGKKAFIVDVREKKSLIAPFSMYRRELADYIDLYDLRTIERFNYPKQLDSYLTKCMQIIANMLDNTRMGSVEYYINHIWKEFNHAVNNFKNPEPMQLFIDNVTAIITMIDYCLEVQLSNMTEKDKQMSMISQIVQNLDEHYSIAGVFEVTKDSIKRIEVKGTKSGNVTHDDPNTIDLSKIKTINIKAI
jgi:hypothetical protein